MPPIINHFFILQREEGRKRQGLNIGKGNSSKVDETEDIQIGPFAAC